MLTDSYTNSCGLFLSQSRKAAFVSGFEMCFLALNSPPPRDLCTRLGVVSPISGSPYEYTVSALSLHFGMVDWLDCLDLNLWPCPSAGAD